MPKPHRKMLELLVCPHSGGSLRLSHSNDWLLCKKSALKYPVRDGVPIMLVSEAEPLDEVLL